ncbi:MAG: hypothetical protein A2504_17080 [Bdellovibrionales bacterium RIFOXYD12_FULL_39_22]|nr:MAG: hypothetical protein A2385_10880 [Bdellovibrionales bacterium RIFOXYB1_FULL_39_21]OFZ40721.1 MAG: hypothetical protein A2485_16850 [Bdellovibrionales bacterium RIFOXYC12_FULL_39_17]OFZ48143.1 MAG: hypothetical protein A2404_17010 [Bdellovibrionales bacterium RIFOXYC1_FULL_39_130]OFZ71975.1 MAG: hypothetical protein A2451_14185 [Bdellovibrionales bacterium RIFOXYC2_FULL_39_8]OFZ75793.1 MAG: hypothetical protein A2560_13510 [Bdellovibrionales bacterium RIFOXYD1_FULL_39_84]OFZ91854.1 MAG:
MTKFSDIEKLDEKELRRLRMNLNNRLESFKRSENPKELAKSHMLHGLGKGECESLLERVRISEKKLSGN